MTSKQPKKKRPPKRTVEQNLNNINSAESERKCEVRCHFYTTVYIQMRANKKTREGQR